MALKTLAHIEKIGGFPVATDEDIHILFHEHSPANRPDWWEWRSKHPVVVDHHNNTISFKIQDGPVKETGINGCQVDTLIHAAKIIIEGLDKVVPCEENIDALYHLGKALEHLETRTKKREARGVEGTSNE